jgi:CBS domain-containing protein
MEATSVKDLMVPLEEYATVTEDASLFDAVMALERAQQELDRERYKYLHRAVLVKDETGKIVGKISQLDAMRALEPKYQEMGDMGRLSFAGFSPAFLRSLMQQQSFWVKPLAEICGKAARIQVKDFMYTPTEGEYIDENASLGEAIHLLVMGHHHSLLVTRNGKIVGILRLTDVFVAVFDLMKQCEQE